MKAPKNESVRVGLRIRPLNGREIKKNSPLCTFSKDNVLEIQKQKDTKQFIFDYVFDLQTAQQCIYQACAFSIVQSSLDGFNGTIFAYGQTGAGKTFTMVGLYKDPVLKGIIPRAFDHVITAIQTSQERKYVICASFIEIYNEDVYDLLDGKGDNKKDLKEDPQRGIFIKDLKSIPVRSVQEMFKILDYGDINRSKAATQMNATSSRSHALFTVHIQSIEGEGKIKGSKLNFVDLAGSERQGKTKAEGATLKEGAKINLSLTALGNVINALVDGRTGHIPYRDSKLTRLLQDSLGGNTKTLMLASVSPAADNYDETMSTLRYAARARNIKNTPKVNEDPKDTMIKEYMAEIEKLKMQLGTAAVPVDTRIEEIQKKAEEQIHIKEQELMEMKKKLNQMEGLILKKENSSIQISEITKKRKLQKKKVQMNEEINEKKLRHIQDQSRKDMEDGETENIENAQTIEVWRSRALRLKKKLKAAMKDKQDTIHQFNDQKERIMNSHTSLELDLSFYKQIAQKFLSKQNIQEVMKRSKINEEKKEYVIAPFLMHEDQLSLPHSLKRHEVDDLWQEKRKHHHMKFVQLPELEPPQTKFNQTTPFIRNRRTFKPFDEHDQTYKTKIQNYSGVMRQNVFMDTNRSFRVSTSRSRSRNSKLQALLKTPEIKKQESQKKSTSKSKYLLTPLTPPSSKP